MYVFFASVAHAPADNRPYTISHRPSRSKKPPGLGPDGFPSKTIQSPPLFGININLGAERRRPIHMPNYITSGYRRDKRNILRSGRRHRQALFRRYEFPPGPVIAGINSTRTHRISRTVSTERLQSGNSLCSTHVDFYTEMGSIEPYIISGIPIDQFRLMGSPVCIIIIHIGSINRPTAVIRNPAARRFHAGLYIHGFGFVYLNGQLLLFRRNTQLSGNRLHRSDPDRHFVGGSLLRNKTPIRPEIHRISGYQLPAGITTAPPSRKVTISSGISPSIV